MERLICKPPTGYRDGLVEHCINRGILKADSDQTYTLCHLADWLQVQSRAKRTAGQAATVYKEENPRQGKTDKFPHKRGNQPTAVFMADDKGQSRGRSSSQQSPSKDKTKAFCPHRNNHEHYLNGCTEFKSLTHQQII